MLVRTSLIQGQPRVSHTELIYWLHRSDVIWLPLLLVRAGPFWERILIKSQRLKILPRCPARLITPAPRGVVYTVERAPECVCV